MESGESDLQVRVRSVTFEAEDILRFDLIAPTGDELPPFTAGAHIDVQVAPGLARQYSLCGDPAIRSVYQIAVLNEVDGRGGSRILHECVRPGDLLTISKPRNLFPLVNEASQHLLLAGGIGITPMMAMAATLESNGAYWHMHVCTRSPQRTAFRDRLAPWIEAGKVSVHHDGGNPENGLDLTRSLRDVVPGRHLYYCGPPGFMTAVASAAGHWPVVNVHCEHFSASPDKDGNDPDSGEFKIRLRSTGETLTVPVDKSIVTVLREHGHHVDTSCEEGYCGTCMTAYLDGDPEHRDQVLDESTRRQYVLICCARSKSPVLVLDL